MLPRKRVAAIQARARSGWSIKKIARVVGVSRNTVRKHTRLSRGPSPPDANASFELALVRRVAVAFGSHDPEDLESVLTVHLAKVWSKREQARDWPALLYDALRKRALSWVRDRDRANPRELSLDASLEPDAGLEGPAIVDATAASCASLDDVVAIGEVQKELGPFLSSVWGALAATRFNLSEAGRLLGVGRNVVRKAWLKIEPVLKRHGF